MKKKHLTYEDRMFIDILLREGYKLKDIAREVDKYPSTISREIKNNRVPDSKGNECSKLERFPFICKNCKYRSNCKKRKYYYNPTKAQEKYLYRLKNSRTGIDMDIDEVEYWDEVLKDRIKVKNQSTLHMFNGINFPKSLPTFYSYVKKGIFASVNDEMLPRLYSFKPRKKKEEKVTFINKHNPIKKGRMYENFEKYIKEHPNANIVEMDNVIRTFEDKYVILTIFFRKSKLMLMFKVLKYKPDSITKVFNTLKDSLGIDEFKRLFEVILTDNGWEFSKPKDIELDYDTGEKLVNIFYCDAYRSWQKGNLERNHEFIRYIIPKGISFDNLTDKNINNMMNHINNTKRKSLDFQTPLKVFSATNHKSTLKALKLKHITEDKVTLSYHILK